MVLNICTEGMRLSAKVAEVFGGGFRDTYTGVNAAVRMLVCSKRFFIPHKGKVQGMEEEVLKICKIMHRYIDTDNIIYYYEYAFVNRIYSQELRYGYFGGLSVNYGLMSIEIPSVLDAYRSSIGANKRGCTGFDGGFEIVEAIRRLGLRHQLRNKIKRKRQLRISCCLIAQLVDPKHPAA